MKRETLTVILAGILVSGCVTPTQQLAQNEKDELQSAEKIFLLHKCPELIGENQCVVRRVNWKYEGKWLNGSADGCVIQLCGDCTYVSASNIAMNNTECRVEPIPPQVAQ